MNSLTNPCIIRGKINFIIHINYFGLQFQAPAFLTKIKCLFAQRRIYHGFCTHVGWDVSYVSFKYTKGEGVRAGKQVFFFLLNDWQTQQMNNAAPYLVLQLLYFVWKCIVLDTRKQWEPSDLIYGSDGFLSGPPEMCPPLGILWPFCSTKLCAKFRDDGVLSCLNWPLLNTAPQLESETWAREKVPVSRSWNVGVTVTFSDPVQ